MLYKSDSKEILLLKEFLNTCRKVVLITHHNPDGDAIGSLLGLYHVLNSCGYKSTAIVPNGFPEFLSWIPGTNNVVRYTDKKTEVKNILLESDLIICLDFNGYRRTEDIGEILAQTSAKKILIDHHPDPESPFDLMFSQTDVSSTAELVFEVIESSFGSKSVSLESAIALFVGIMTDTGSFSFACSRSRTFQIAGELISKGISVEKIQGLVYNNFSTERMKLMGYALNDKMKVFPEYRSAYISLSKAELKKYNHRNGDTEGFVNLPLTINGVIFSALFIEHDSFIKVSLRSRGTFPVNILCNKHFYGGGHVNAAGGKFFATLSDTEKYFENLLTQYSNDLNSSKL